MRTILDVSSVVYGGHCGNPDSAVQGFPIGGLRKVLGLISSEINMGEVALCLDGGNLLRKELLPEYKANRVPNYSVMAQIDLLKEILDDCGIPYYVQSGIEADDFIYSLVHLLSSFKDDEHTQIYSDDRDVSCCVTSLVEIKNITVNGAHITRDNYEKHLIRGNVVPYNTVLLYKLLHGDASDNYGALKIAGARFDILAQEYLNLVTPYLESGAFPECVFADYELFTAFVNQLPSNYTNSMRQKLLDRGRIVYPYLVDVTDVGLNPFRQLVSSGIPLHVAISEHTKFFSLNTINLEKFNFYCSYFKLLNCKPSAWRYEYIAMGEEFGQKLKMMVSNLTSGVSAVKYSKNKVGSYGEATLSDLQLPI